MENNAKQFRVTDEIVASLNLRLLNWLIDVIVQTLIFVALFTAITNIANSYGNKQLPAYLLINPIGQYTFVSIITLSYYITLETLLGRTLGKFVTQTIVVDEYGERPGHLVILIRSICRIIPFYWLAFFFNPKRGLHDAVSRTYVVNNKDLEEKKHQFHSLKKTTNAQDQKD